MIEYKTLHFRWFNSTATRQVRVSDLEMPKFSLFTHNDEVWYSLTNVQPDWTVTAVHASGVYFVE